MRPLVYLSLCAALASARADTSLAAGQLRPGCFAWSSRLHAAACVVGRSSVNEEREGCTGGSWCEKWQVVFLGADAAPIPLGASKDDAIMGDGANTWGATTTHFPLDAATRAKLERQLAAGGFQRLTAPRRPLAHKHRLVTLAPRFVMRWSDAVSARCGGGDYVELGLPLDEGSHLGGGREDRQSAAVRALGGFVLVEAIAGYGMEGQYASSVSAALVDVGSCQVRSGVVP